MDRKSFGRPSKGKESPDGLKCGDEVPKSKRHFPPGIPGRGFSQQTREELIRGRPLVTLKGGKKKKAWDGTHQEVHQGKRSGELETRG